MTRALLLAFACAACGSSSTDTPTSETHYTAPENWRQTVVREPGRVIARWIPEKNPNKEAISLIRSALPASVAGTTDLTPLLLDAQRALHGKTDTPATFQTNGGMTATLVDVDFTPPGLTQTYHRVHAIVRDGSTIINVLYTARTPDPDLVMFHSVLDGIHHGEG